LADPDRVRQIQQRQIFGLLSTDYDIVLIDSSPLLPVADPLVLSGYADAVLIEMVGQTTRAEVERASEHLAQVTLGQRV
jgi:Mrp family chromosome partitioning ATPase